MLVIFLVILIKIQTRTIVRQWGSLLGAIIPKEIVKKEKIITMDELIIDVK